ncbi:preprotein translocase subunit SecY [Frischella sp. Ac48]|uniref:Protein translocase subunit SecY n=1 Tax=Frischella japonica TaxID=2741544 RepID=A0ABR7QUA9_9GAMM|nr:MULTISPECIES: preprotein translocase subunit SecY [Frischella]MBC9129801.1 preprotein translocase subunit SecY [Frischella japonica]MBX4132791.1 preprotein translocase subunit SecY [Frischella sp. Ac48]
MAKQPGFDFKSTRGGSSELTRRLMFVLLALIVFRIGSYIPVPGINTEVLTRSLSKMLGDNGLIGMFNMFSGGALSRASIFTLGIMPYISASIIVQLLTAISPKLAELKKEGESGRKKISQYTRYGTLVLAIIQAVGVATSLPRMEEFKDAVINPGFSFYFIASVSLVTGTMFLMWLGEQITERGVGNGISIIIFAGIVAALPPAIYETIEQARSGELNRLVLLVVAALLVGITYFVVFVERGQRRIVVNYAQRQQGRRVYAAQSTHLPLKINMSGVIPAIFASTIIMLPVMAASWLQGDGEGWRYIFVLMRQYLSHDQPLYMILYAAAIIFFCFFYTALVFNPRETADQLKKSGAFIPGIRPGEQTAKYIDKIMTRLTLVGSLYITLVCLVPMFITSTLRVPVQFGGTSLLIVVVVIMDFMAQVQTLMMPNRYESVLKKANLKGYGR